MSKQKTIIVTGGSQGIGAGVVNAFIERGYNVVATSRNVTKSKELVQSDNLALIDGDIGQAITAEKVAELQSPGLAPSIRWSTTQVSFYPSLSPITQQRISGL